MARTSEFQEERQLLHSDSLLITNERIFGTHGFERQELDTFETYVTYHPGATHLNSNAVISGADSDEFAGYAGTSSGGVAVLLSHDCPNRSCNN